MIFTRLFKDILYWQEINEITENTSHDWIGYLKAGLEQLETGLEYFKKNKIEINFKLNKESKIFIVHGRNHNIRDKIDLFLRRDLNLKTIVMEAGPFSGRTLSEKFEEMAEESNIALFIYTADDNLIDKESNKEIKRARQNVVLETGYFWGALGRRGKVIFLVEDVSNLDLPSDILGIGWIKITDDLGETKLRLQKELRAIGIL